MNLKQNDSLQPRARALRKNMTPEERRLWYCFLKRCPAKFRRQQIVGNYIADFYCHSCRLVVEVDGTQHFEDAGQDYDRQRDDFMRGLGLIVLRYSNADINQRFDSVCEDILQHLSK
jgi:very-short-patch-repair endonuclease